MCKKDMSKKVENHCVHQCEQQCKGVHQCETFSTVQSNTLTQMDHECGQNIYWGNNFSSSFDTLIKLGQNHLNSVHSFTSNLNRMENEKIERRNNLKTLFENSQSSWLDTKSLGSAIWPLSTPSGYVSTQDLKLTKELKVAQIYTSLELQQEHSFKTTVFGDTKY